MRLLDLEPKFLRWALETAPASLGRKLPDGTTQWGGFDSDTFHCAASLQEADGIEFDCPLCSDHRLHVYFQGRNVPPHLGKDSAGNTARWSASGTGFEDLTLQPSILVKYPCGWHGFVTNGEITQ
jgi:hypothetical protein